jgi:hypothetical protein
MHAHIFLKIYGKGFLRTCLQRWEKLKMDLKALEVTNMKWIRLTHCPDLAKRTVGFRVA